MNPIRRKLLLILLAAVSLNGCGGAGDDRRDGSDIGTVRFVNLEGGFWGIYGDGGGRYDAINLPDDFKQEGTRISFAFIERDDLASIHQWGLVIELVRVELAGI